MDTQRKIREFQNKIDNNARMIKKIEYKIDDFEDFRYQFLVMRDNMEENLSNKGKQLDSEHVSHKKVKAFKRYQSTANEILNGNERTKVRQNFEQNIIEIQNKITKSNNEIDELRAKIRHYERCIDDLEHQLRIG